MKNLFYRARSSKFSKKKLTSLEDVISYLDEDSTEIRNSGKSLYRRSVNKENNNQIIIHNYLASSSLVFLSYNVLK